MAVDWDEMPLAERAELNGLRVAVDALKRDVGGLRDRVTRLEAVGRVTNGGDDRLAEVLHAAGGVGLAVWFAAELRARLSDKALLALAVWVEQLRMADPR